MDANGNIRLLVADDQGGGYKDLIEDFNAQSPEIPMINRLSQSTAETLSTPCPFPLNRHRENMRRLRQMKRQQENEVRRLKREMRKLVGNE
jgi:hypothetical protein